MTYIHASETIPEWSSLHPNAVPERLIANGYQYVIMDTNIDVDPADIADELGRVLMPYTYYGGHFYFRSKDDAMWVALVL